MPDLSSPVLLAIADGVAVLTLNRPQRMNAVDAATHGELRAALDEIERRTDIGALILTGRGRAFCGGQDLAERRAMLAEGEVDLHASLEQHYNPLVRRIAALPHPTIAAVNGIAAGAGAAIALNCDIVIAALSAAFQFSFAKVALGPDSGTSYLLPRLIGPARAMALALTAQPLSAATAAQWGMIWKAVPDEELTAEAEALACHLAAGPRPALAAIKAQLRSGLDFDFSTCLDAERDAQGRLGHHPHYREAVTAFTEKRSPLFANPAASATGKDS